MTLFGGFFVVSKCLLQILFYKKPVFVKHGQRRLRIRVPRIGLQFVIPERLFRPIPGFPFVLRKIFRKAELCLRIPLFGSKFQIAEGF